MFLHQLAGASEKGFEIQRRLTALYSLRRRKEIRSARERNFGRLLSDSRRLIAEPADRNVSMQESWRAASEFSMAKGFSLQEKTCSVRAGEEKAFGVQR